MIFTTLPQTLDLNENFNDLLSVYHNTQTNNQQFAGIVELSDIRAQVAISNVFTNAVCSRLATLVNSKEFTSFKCNTMLRKFFSELFNKVSELELLKSTLNQDDAKALDAYLTASIGIISGCDVLDRTTLFSVSRTLSERCADTQTLSFDVASAYEHNLSTKCIFMDIGILGFETTYALDYMGGNDFKLINISF